MEEKLATTVAAAFDEKAEEKNNDNPPPYKKQGSIKITHRDERFKHSVECVEDVNGQPRVYYRTEKGKKILFFEMKIKRISEIDTSAETFRCRFHIYFTWLASQSECQQWDSLKKGQEFKPKWTPTFAWSNGISLHPTDTGPIAFKIKDGWKAGSVRKGAWNIENDDFGFPPHEGRWIRVKYEYDIEFAEELELIAFPFDCQDLSLFLKVDSDKVSQCDIVPFPRHNEFCMLDPEFSVLSEWDFENMVCEFYKTDSVKSKSSKEYSLVGVRIKAARRWEAHIGHMLVTFCMFSLGLGTFAQGFDGDELGNRLSYCVTLLLADVATIQLLFDNLPNIPYWTLFDLYIYTCFGFLSAVTGWTAWCGAFGQFWQDLDDYVFGFCSFFWLVVQAVYIMRAMRQRRQERLKLNMTSLELDEHFFKDSKTDRDRRAIAVVWNKDNVGATDSDEYGMYVKGSRKDKQEKN